MDSSKESAFYKLCEWFDSEMESGVYTVSQLHEQMKTLAGDDLPVYHERYLKQALEKHYGNSIFITNQEHKKNIVCFRNCTADIIRDYHKKMETGIEDEKKRTIIKTAASLIMNDIKCLNFDKEEFPSLIEMTSHYELPESLQLLLTYLMPRSSVRQNVAGQNIISSLMVASGVRGFTKTLSKAYGK